MQLLKVGSIYLPNCYPSEVDKNGVLEYFIKGHGWKKTKKYKIIEGVDLPDRSSILSWLDIAILFDKYGMEVANQYADNKTAGIISRDTVMKYGTIYRLIKQELPENFDPLFFDCLTLDYMCALFGLFLFDISETDKKLSQIDRYYNNVKCTYKGKPTVSMKEYIDLKYGPAYSKIIDILISYTNIETNPVTH